MSYLAAAKTDAAEAQLVAAFSEKVAECETLQAELKKVKTELLTSKRETSSSPSESKGDADDELARSIALGKKNAAQYWHLKAEFAKCETARQVAEARVALLQEALEDARRERDRRHDTHLYLRTKVE